MKIRLFLLTLILLSVFSETYSSLSTSTLMFKHLSTEDGLSDNNIKHIFRDSRGFLWIGTSSGLNKYDGYSFQQFYKNNSHLPDDHISEIFEDPNQNIWIRMSQGYSIYNYQTGEFNNNHQKVLENFNIPSKQILRVGCTDNVFWAYDSAKLYVYQANAIKVYPLQTQDISCISVGKQFIYVIYSDGHLIGINRLTSETGNVPIPDKYLPEIKDKRPSIYTDHDGGLWLHTFQNSLLLYKGSIQASWERIEIRKNKDIPFNRIHHILDMRNGNTCILTSHMGLFMCNKQTKTLSNITHQPTQPHTLSSNNLTTAHLDHENNLWIGNFKHGISYYSPMLPMIFSNQKSSYDVLSFCKDEENQSIYYGTDGHGVIHQSLVHDRQEELPIPANVVVDLCLDKEKRLWIGSFQNGLICYHNGKSQKFTTQNSDILDNDIYDVEVDKNGYIWLGTLTGFIQRYDPQTRKFETLIHRPGEFFIHDMYYDQRNSLYVATNKGLIYINTDTHSYSFHRKNDGFLEDDILTVYKDSRGLIWAGHPHGLSIWNEQTNSTRYIEPKEGLTANFIKTIIEDNFGQMWIGTGNGVSRIEVKKDHFSIVNYSVSDGLICNDANIHATMKLDNGNILIGTPKGYQTIVPQEIIRTDYQAEVYLTDIKLPPQSNLEKILDGHSMEYTESITLNPWENTLTLSFSAMNLIESDKIRYAYQIGGRKAPWINAESNKVNLSMLPTGNHTLSVKVQNSQGMWSPNIKKIEIKVLALWYQSWWAYTIYLILFIGSILFIIRHIRMKEKQELILKSIEEENRRQQEINNMKLQFFANISHELRTPLSLVINPLEEFFESHPEHRKGMLDIVKKNANYLLELINQLLDFRRLDANAEILKCKHDNILIILGEIFHSFDSVAQKRHIDYTFNHSESSIYMDFDYDKIRKITTNILSNAFKFTPTHGSISLTLEVSGTRLILSFADSGPGIEDECKEKVFQRFYQSNKNNSSYSGSGIGLHIVSEYVKMHQGEIYIKDNHPCGSIFQLSLPLHQNLTDRQETEKGTEEENIEVSANEGLITILLVDDNPDFLKFLSESLSKHYHILTASNGKQALELLDKEDIYLIVSDIMMPEMDGLELCTAVKNDIRYSHISIILLTAKASEEHLLEGLHVGADDYITKPFNMEILKLRISKIIEMNSRRIEHFKNEINIEPSKITITPLDQQLVEKAIEIVEKNIGEPEFSVEELSSALNLSRSYFYKKMTRITGKKPIEFIRTIRMKRARQLLAESQMQVAEIAYMLGYNSPKIFSKHFKEEFNISPSSFKKQQMQEVEEEDGEQTVESFRDKDEGVLPSTR